MPQEFGRAMIIAESIIVILVSGRHDSNRSQMIKNHKAVWNDFLEMVEVLGRPVSDYYKGPLTYYGTAIWESIHEELVFRARSVLLMEKKRGPICFSNEVLEEVKLAKEWFVRVHSIALKYQLAEKEYDSYFEAAKKELEKGGSK
jgi:hypothetical protein